MDSRLKTIAKYYTRSYEWRIIVTLLNDESYTVTFLTFALLFISNYVWDLLLRMLIMLNYISSFSILAIILLMINFFIIRLLCMVCQVCIQSKN